MLKQKFLALTILLFLFLFHSIEKVSAVELITNGGFETGNFTGWTVATSGNGWYPWQVTGTGGGDGITGGIQASSPQQGSFDAWTGFCCNTVNNPEYIQQDVTIPTGQTASIHWLDKVQSNLTAFCTVPSCGSNTYRVQILNPTTNAVLQNLYVFTANGGANYNTGWVTHGIVISHFAGQTIRIRFSGTYASGLSGHLNGPGRAEVDAVSVQSPALPTAANVSVGGKITNNGKSGISRASVTLTDAGGNSRTVLSNQFGGYKFDNVQAGETYTLVVNHGKYNFADNPRIINVDDNLTNIDFYSSP